MVRLLHRTAHRQTDSQQETATTTRRCARCPLCSENPRRKWQAFGCERASECVINSATQHQGFKIVKIMRRWLALRSQHTHTHTRTQLDGFSRKINSFLRNSLDFFYCTAVGDSHLFRLLLSVYCLQCTRFYAVCVQRIRVHAISGGERSWCTRLRLHTERYVSGLKRHLRSERR